MTEEEGYVLLRYKSGKQKELLKKMIVKGDFELVKKRNDIEDDDDDGGGGGKFEEWGSDYAGKNSTAVYQFMNG